LFVEKVKKIVCRFFAAKKAAEKSAAQGVKF